MRQRALPVLRRLLINLEHAEKLIMRRHGQHVLRRLLTNPGDAENLTMRRHGLRGLATLSEAEKLIEMPPLFGAESFQLRILPPLFLPM